MKGTEHSEFYLLSDDQVSLCATFLSGLLIVIFAYLSFNYFSHSMDLFWAAMSTIISTIAITAMGLVDMVLFIIFAERNRKNKV